MTEYATLTMAERIRSARACAGWTQKQLAEAIGTKQANISHIEAGRQSPTAQVSDRIFHALRNASPQVSEMLDSYDRVLGIQGRSHGKLGVVTNLMEKPTPKEWFVGGFLARGYVTILAGQEGAGKSTVAQTLAVALANRRTEAFGFHLSASHSYDSTSIGMDHSGARYIAVRPTRILIIDVENVMMINEQDIDASLVAERLQRFGLTDTSADNITVLGASGFDLDKDSDIIGGVLTDAAKEDRPYDVVILDSLRSLCTSVSENTPDIGRVLTKLNQLAFKHDCGVLLLHHTNKAGAAYSGHTAIGSTVAAVWTFSRLVHRDSETGRKDQHPTGRFLNPYKVRIAAEAQGRLVSIGADGITSNKAAGEYEGFTVDATDEEE